MRTDEDKAEMQTRVDTHLALLMLRKAKLLEALSEKFYDLRSHTIFLLATSAYTNRPDGRAVRFSLQHLNMYIYT